MQAGRMHPDTVSPTAGRIYAEICTRRKAYETRGISCCAPFVYAGNGFLASRPSPPCAPRPGYRALFIRYERCLHGIFKTWRCSKIRAITDNFFFFRIYIYMYVRNIHVYMYVRKETCYVGSLDYPEAEQGWKISPRPTKKRKGRPLKRTDRESSQMAPDIEQSTLYKLLPAKPTVSNYLTHSKTSRKSPTPPDQAFDPISTEQRPNRICIYIYIHDFAHN